MLNSDRAVEVGKVSLVGCRGEGGVAGFGLVLIGWLDRAWERGGYVGRSGSGDEVMRKGGRRRVGGGG